MYTFTPSLLWFLNNMLSSKMCRQTMKFCNLACPPPLSRRHSTQYIIENKLIAKGQIGFTPKCRETGHLFMLKTPMLASKYVKDNSGKLRILSNMKEKFRKDYDLFWSDKTGK